MESTKEGVATVAIVVEANGVEVITTFPALVFVLGLVVVLALIEEEVVDIRMLVERGRLTRKGLWKIDVTAGGITGLSVPKRTPPISEMMAATSPGKVSATVSATLSCRRS